jgi:carotenoid cleavage dioxygenase
VPRHGPSSAIRWFEASPTFVLHFVNAYEEGDEIVLDGFHQGAPEPSGEGITDKWLRAFRYLALDQMQTRLHRWRFNLVTGAVREERLSESLTEFGMVNGGYAARPHRYAYAATGVPGRFLFDGLVKHDVVTGSEERVAFGDGVFGSETAMAPRLGSTGEDDGYLVTIVSDVNADASFCHVYAAQAPSAGPVCVLRLPERVSSGTHATWVDGAEVRRWREVDEAPSAVGL